MLLRFTLKSLGLLALLLIIVWLFVARPFVLFPDTYSLDIPADPIELERHVRMLSEEIGPRSWTDTENLQRTSEYVASEFRKSTSRVSFQRFHVGDIEYRNIFAEFGRRTGPILVVGAHYDTADSLPGADDNASGVAGVIELARLLGEKPVNKHVVLAAYPLEEPPFFATENMGSAVHASSLLNQNEKVKFMISLEMIGYFSEKPGSQFHPIPALKLFYPSVGNFIAVIGKLDLSPTTLEVKRAFLESTDLPVHSVNAPTWMPGIDFSDHRNFWNRGIEAVMVTDTAFFRNPYYHTAHDTAEKLDYNKMAEVVNGVYAFLSRS